MSLRESPDLTLASVVGRRTNAMKSTGPRTERGGAAVTLNPVKHDWRAVALQVRLARAGCRAREANVCPNRCRIRSRISRTRARDRTTDVSVTPTVLTRPSTDNTRMVAMDSLRSTSSFRPPEALRASERSRNVIDAKRFGRICRSSAAGIASGAATETGERGLEASWRR
jgi:hypothetical protein